QARRGGRHRARLVSTLPCRGVYPEMGVLGTLSTTYVWKGLVWSMWKWCGSGAAGVTCAGGSVWAGGSVCTGCAGCVGWGGGAVGTGVGAVPGGGLVPCPWWWPPGTWPPIWGVARGVVGVVGVVPGVGGRA